ncbi:ferritin-like domain-containing protein [Sphingomonas echinoides]|uniref:Ferritin-like domain-containing protein n=2 Tax=Pseudomonadota TaxID=1224 RepID=A0ABU4PPC6_9SPHN|nr:ferritin-like domain-containing protein [Sphingomonas echinoides]MDX5985667.1 ferritin-like domain-containing protein [Sphingomonas echinoides]
MDLPDPVTPLTPAEQAFVATLNTTWTRDQVLTRLKADLQTAVEIELATIPIYLYTYYSLVRNNESGETISDAQLYANKAGGIIMSVAVEEMLHMSLSSNILWSMGVMPQLYGKAPGAYPTGLPYHNPQGPAGPDGKTAVQIPLGKLSFEQLWHFLQIEYPEQWNAPPQDSNWDTIGQFYSYIRCLLSTQFLEDSDFQRGSVTHAIQPYNYSPNNVDTVYPSAGFDPWKPAPPAAVSWADPVQGAAAAAVYPDADDSHAGATQLVAIRSIRDAATAIDTICDQGEGVPIQPVGPSAYDDPSKSEESHYVKFLTLQAQFADYAGTGEVRPAQPPAPAEVIQPAVTSQALLDAGVLVNMPESPLAASYPEHYVDIANFCSACFQYMLVMTETIYLVPPEQQKVFFNEGLHRSMIWVLDKYIRTIRQIPIPTGDYAGMMMGPTFEHVSLGDQKISFQGLTDFGNKAIAAANALIARCDVSEVVEHVQTLFAPGANTAKAMKIEKADNDLIGVLKNVIYYVGVAISKTGTNNVPMHLPDVGPYWTAAQNQ